MQNRKTLVVVNGKITLVSIFSHTGLPQGSPLSPILYLFFNSDLVCSVINKNKGAIAFIDDYTTWVTSSNIVENLVILQTKIVPYLESWALSSGATFQAKKTCMVNFTQNKKRILDAKANMPLIIKNQRIHASQEVKILGVVLDFELRYSSHITQACKQGIIAVLALKQLKI